MVMILSEAQQRLSFQTALWTPHHRLPSGQG